MLDAAAAIGVMAAVIEKFAAAAANVLVVGAAAARYCS